MASVPRDNQRANPNSAAPPRGNQGANARAPPPPLDPAPQRNRQKAMVQDFDSPHVTLYVRHPNSREIANYNPAAELQDQNDDEHTQEEHLITQLKDGLAEQRGLIDQLVTRLDEMQGRNQEEANRLYRQLREMEERANKEAQQLHRRINRRPRVVLEERYRDQVCLVM